MRCALLCAGIAFAGFAQGADQRPAFEVASLKASAPGEPYRMTGGPGTADPGRFICTGWSLDNFVLRAYQIRAYQLSAPQWFRDARFSVAATIPAGTTRDQFQLMLQRLLEERFQMKVHREKKEMAIYELGIAKGGSKLVEASATPPPAGASGVAEKSGRARIQFRQQTMDNFAYLLSAQVDRPVIDATGLTGKYAIELSWDRENADTGLTIFRALPDQLGLKLEPKKGPVEMVVVDHTEKIPIEN